MPFFDQQATTVLPPVFSFFWQKFFLTQNKKEFWKVLIKKGVKTFHASASFATKNYQKRHKVKDTRCQIFWVPIGHGFGDQFGPSSAQQYPMIFFKTTI